jgi:hypothetical protein
VQQERLPRPLVEPLTLQETAAVHVNDSFLDSLAPPAPQPVKPSATVEAAAATPAGIPSPNLVEAPPQSDGRGWAVRVTETAETAAATAVNGTGDDKIPLESYSSRQKSLGFLAGLIDRWT